MLEKIRHECRVFRTTLHMVTVRHGLHLIYGLDGRDKLFREFLLEYETAKRPAGISAQDLEIWRDPDFKTPERVFSLFMSWRRVRDMEEEGEFDG